VESSRAARFRELEKNVDDISDVEKDDDPIERVELQTPSSHNGTNAPSETSSVHDQRASRRRVIRFEDGDPENPNNWGRVSRGSLCFSSGGMCTNGWCSGRKYMPSSLPSCQVGCLVDYLHLSKANVFSHEQYYEFESSSWRNWAHITAFQRIQSIHARAAYVDVPSRVCMRPHAVGPTV
jgi:hypothetical protein